MPTYAYACKECGHRFDAVQSFADPSLTECPQCGGALRKQYGTIGVTFNGAGFYRNDSRAGEKRPSEKKGSDAASAGSSAGSGGSGGSGGSSKESGGSGGSSKGSGGSGGSGGSSGSGGSGGDSGSSSSSSKSAPKPSPAPSGS